MDVWHTTTLIWRNGGLIRLKPMKGKLVFLPLFLTVMLLSTLVSVNATTGVWRLITPTEYTGIPDSNMHSVYMLSGGTSGKGSGNGWAVSDNGFVFNWDGFSWNQAGSPTDCQLNSVNFGGPLNSLSSITSSSGWIVGGVAAGAGAVCTAGGNGAALYFNGVGWTSYPVPSGASPTELRSVSLVKSASFQGDFVQAFAVGTENGVNGAFWVWNGVPGSGGAWSEDLISGPVAVPLNSVYMTHCTGSPCTADDGIAVGNAGATNIYHYTGGTWTALLTPVPGVNLNSVSMSSRTSGWAVGDSCTIVHTTDAITWTGAVSPGACTTSLRSIVLTSSSQGWAVGDSDASGAVVLFGTSLDSAPTWTKLSANQVATLLDLNFVTFASSGGNIWSVGDSGVAAFCLSNCGSTSAIWSTTTATHRVAMNSVFMVSDSDGWAVGNIDPTSNPTILRWNGGSFSWTRAPSVSPLTISALYGVHLSGGSSGWTVGGTGAAYSTLWYDGNTWTGRAVPACVLASCILRSVYMVSDSNSWAVGDRGVIMHSTSSGGGFATVAGPALPAGTDLFSVFFDPTSGGQSGWAVGGGGGVIPPVIIHTTSGGGDAWGTVIPNPGGVVAPVILRSLFFQDATHGWAAGTGTTILYWNGVSWTLVGVVGAANPIDINGISVLGGPPATDGWAVGRDTVTGLPVTIHYDGTTWTVTSLTPAITVGGGLNALSLRSSTNGLAVGTQVTAFPLTVSFILHLDPPPGGGGGTTVATTASTSSAVTTSTATSTSSLATTSSTTSSTSSEISSSSIQTSTSTSSEVTSSQTTSTESTPSSTATVTVTLPSSSTTTPLVMPAIPGFPIESILVGIILGLTTLAIVRRRRK